MRPEARVRRLEPERRAGHGDRGRARVEHLLRVAVEVDGELEQLGSAAASRGTATKQSKTTSPFRPSCTSMKPPPPGPVSIDSQTQETNAAATQASTAFPPASSTRRARLGRQRMAGCDRAFSLTCTRLRRSSPNGRSIPFYV